MGRFSRRLISLWLNFDAPIYKRRTLSLLEPSVSDASLSSVQAPSPADVIPRGTRL